MNADFFRRVEEIFHTASRMERGARTEFVHRACGDDRDLQAEVEALLAHDERPANYLRTPVLDAGVTLREQFLHTAERGSAPMPRRIGSYRPLQVIGEGGFGVVYLAEQEMPRRTVAIKVIRPGLATRSILKRFEYEAQILGRLHHPYIAQIYEAGMAEVEYPPDSGPVAEAALGGARPSVSGRQAFVAMEYIRGRPLNDYARETRLDLRGRLELVARLCEGVQHAHQKGIIHRDLKPANILVVEDDPGDSRAAGGDGDPREGVTTSSVPSTLRRSVATPKILDFGVARAADPELSSTTVQTDIGQMIGTLPYMSPEQVAGDPSEVDTRSDVYALGVILFELLAGRLPYDLSSRSIPDAARIIRDQPPTRLSSLNRSLRGEIEVIVSKALEKNKARRYQSAADLGDDLRRHLTGEPIAARRDSALYVLRKQLRRYWGVAAAAAVFIVLLAGFGAYAWSQSREFARQAAREYEAKLAAIEAHGAAERARLTVEEALRVAQGERARADAYAGQLGEELTVSNIERSRLAARMGNMLAAEQTLWREHALDPSSRHSYWALWELYSRSPWLVTVQAHEPETTALRFSADSRRLVSGGSDGVIQIWNCRSWERVASLREHRDRIVAIETDPYSRFVAALGADNRLVVFDLPDGRSRYALTIGDTANPAMAISPDGRWLVTGGGGRAEIAIHHAETGELETQLPVDRRGVISLAFSPDGQQLAASGRDATIRVFDLPWDPETRPKLLRPPSGGVASVAFSIDGRRVFAGGADRVMRVWDVESRRLIAQPQSPNDTISRLRLMPDGKRLASSGWWTINIWNPDTCEYAGSLSLPQGALSFDFSADGQWLACGSMTGQVRVFQRRTDGAFVRSDGHGTRCSATIRPDDRFIALGDASGQVKLWEPYSGRPPQDFAAHTARVHTLRFDPTGRLLATGGADRTLRIWDVQTGSCVEWFPRHAGKSSWSFSWSADGRWIADTTLLGVVRIIDTHTWETVASVPHDPGELLAVAFDPAAEHIVVTVRNRPLRIWTRSGRLVGTLPDPGTPWTADFNADGTLIASGNWDREIHVYDWRVPDEIATLEGHTATVWSADFHPTDPILLASSSADGTVRLWDVENQRCLVTFEELLDSEVISLRFSDDGTRLVAANSLGTVAVWDLTYFDRHVAGQVDYQIQRLKPLLGERVRADELRTWANEVLRSAVVSARQPP